VVFTYWPPPIWCDLSSGRKLYEGLSPLQQPWHCGCRYPDSLARYRGPMSWIIGCVTVRLHRWATKRREVSTVPLYHTNTHYNHSHRYNGIKYMYVCSKASMLDIASSSLALWSSYLPLYPPLNLPSTHLPIISITHLSLNPQHTKEQTQSRPGHISPPKRQLDTILVQLIPPFILDKTQKK
jgi:hypothetical protein